MHGNSGYEDDARPLARALRARVRRTPRRWCRRARRASASCASTAVGVRRAAGLRADRVPGRRARRRGRRRVVPAPRDAAPDLPLAARAARRRPAASGCCGRCAGSTWSSSATRDECCGFGGTFAVKNADTSMAMLGDKLRRVLDTRAEVCTAVDTSCLMHIGGALRAPARGRARDAHGRDPGGAANEGLPGGGARGAARTPSCAATSARRRRRSGPSAPQAVAELRRLGGAARRRRGDQGARDGDAAGAARAARGER